MVKRVKLHEKLKEAEQGRTFHFFLGSVLINLLAKVTCSLLDIVLADFIPPAPGATGGNYARHQRLI